MSEKTPPVKTDPPAGDPPAEEPGFSVKLVDNKDETAMQEKMDAMAKDNAEMKAIIVKQETERELAKFEKQRSEKLERLHTLHPALATKHKDTKDLGILQTAIETAEEFKSGFPEYQAGEKGKEEKPRATHQKPKMYKK